MHEREKDEIDPVRFFTLPMRREELSGRLHCENKGQ